jgi:type IV pilus assembly protein PilQ
MKSPRAPARSALGQLPIPAGAVPWSRWGWLLLLLLLWGLAPLKPAGAADLQDVQFAALPGNRVEVQLTLSEPVPAPETFSTDSPARIALDFPGVSSKLDRKAVPIGVGAVHSLVAVEASDRTRVVLNLNDSVPYEVTTSGNQVMIRLNTQDADAGAPAPLAQQQETAPRPATASGARPRPVAARPQVRTSGGSGAAVRDIDFRRGDTGEGRVAIKLPSAETRVAVREQGSRVFVDLYDTTLPQRLFRRLDVSDFATPVSAVESRPKGRNVEVEIQTGSDFDHLAYQTDDLFTLEFRSLTPSEKEEAQRQKVVYSGDRLSLNFQDIEVRAVLQLLADFTGLNLVASDTVKGNITLRLKNVPWDQALDIILKTKGLSMRQTGNVIMVAPTQEVAAQEKLELESQQQIEDLSPLRSEFIQVNYAKAAELASMIKSKETNMLSERGNVTVDSRTNTLIVQDTTAKLDDIRGIVGRLDIPVRQVMVESRVVIANNDFARDLGVRFGVSGSTGSGPKPIRDPQTGEIVSWTGGDTQLLTAGGLPGNLSTFNYERGAFGRDVTTGVPFNSALENPSGSGNDALMVNLPAPTPSGAVNFLIGKVGSYLLQLELSAMQREGRGEIVSSPRVITSDGHQATIKVGQEIPYQQQSGGTTGGTNVSFKEAVLQLDVTPQITPDDRIIMDLKVNKDAPDFTRTVLGQPPIDTRSVETSVLVDNGETVVLGGVYEREKTFQKEQVPWLGDIPVLGRLFKLEQRQDNNSELLIFVTPKILKGEIASN